MNVAFFFTERVRIIRYYNDNAVFPFTETQRKIEAKEPPYDCPPYSEDGEPAFLEEWLDADTGIELLGRTCISMLSASLKLYLETWEKELRIKWKKNEKRDAWRKGFSNGYLKALAERRGVALEKSAADLSIVEQIFLARNRDQHPERITSMSVTHSSRDMRKYPKPFFVTDRERARYEKGEMRAFDLLISTVNISPKLLHQAIEESEKLVEWLEPQFIKAKYPNARP